MKVLRAGPAPLTLVSLCSLRAVLSKAKLKMMNDLQQHLDRLMSFIRQSVQPLSWTRVLIVEDTAITHGKFLSIPRSALTTPEAYATQFESHLNAGHSWINMNAAGVIDETLLVIIELPQYTNTVPKEKVSVNLSGPSIRTANQIKIVG